MAVSGNVSLTVIARAQENIRAVLQQSNNAIRKTKGELQKAGIAQTKLGAAVARSIRGQGVYRASLIRTADRVGAVTAKLGMMRNALGLLAVAFAMRAIRDFTVEGEKAANIAMRFADAIPNATANLEKLKEVTAGLVTETELQIIANRFKRLGVPIKTTTRLLELAAKAATDQGRSVVDVARVIESSLKGRTTGLVDIGVNIDKITGLTKAYAAATGVAVKDLDEMDRRMKVALPAALKALGDQFDAVDMEKFRLDMQQTATAWDDLVSRWQEGAAHIFSATVDAFTPAEEKVSSLVGRFARLDSALNESKAYVEENKDSWFAMWAMEGKVEERTEELNKQLFALRDRLIGMRPEDRIAAFNSLSSAMGRMSAEARETITALFRLRSARAEIGRRGLTWDFAADVAAGGPASDWWNEQVTKMTAIATEPTKRKGSGGGGGSRKKQAEAELARLKKIGEANKQRFEAQTKAQEDANIVALLGTDIERKKLKLHFKDLAIRKKAKEILDEDVRNEWQRVKLRALDIEQSDIAIGQKEKLAADQADLRAARGELELAKETSEEMKVQIQLRLDIEAIRNSELSTEEKKLAIKRMEIEAEKEIGRIQEENRESALAYFGDIAGGAFGEAAGAFAEMDEKLEELGRPKRFETISRGFGALAQQSGAISKAVAGFATAVGKSNGEVAKGAIAAVGAVAPVVAAFGQTIAEKSAIQMAFELAMGTALMFVPGAQAEAAAHFTAAAMFGVLAGVAASMPTTSMPEETAGAGGGLITPAGGFRGEEAAAQVIVNLAPGTIMGLPQEMGAAIADRIASMSGTGFAESTAF